VTSFHTVHVELSQGWSRTEVSCSAPEGAPCREDGGPDCHCEEIWTKTETDGRRFHYKDREDVDDADFETDPSPFARVAKHYHRDSGECQQVIWINESDTDECVDGTVTLSKPVELTWDGDGYMMKEVEG
jgi:hypothetical protein